MRVLIATIAFLVWTWAEASASEGPGNEVTNACSNLVQFPKSKNQNMALELLPSHFHNRPLASGLRHLLDVATSARKKEIRGQTISLVELEKLDASKMRMENNIFSSETLRIPEDFLSAQEIDGLRTRIQNFGFANVLDTSLELPLLQTFPIRGITIEGHTQVVAATVEGYPVLLEHLPAAKMQGLDGRASACFVVAGLKILSDKGVVPHLLGVTRMEDGSLMAVFPIPAGFKSTELTALQIGLDISRGFRNGKTPEPFGPENSRIAIFEDLIERLRDSQWPMQNFAVDLAELTTAHPDVSASQIIGLLKLPLWEARDNSGYAQSSFFYPSYFAAGNSSWLPTLFSNPMASTVAAASPSDEIEITTMSTDKSKPIAERLVRIPLQPIDPTSKFGRINLLRFEFFVSLLNSKAKVGYLNFLSEKSVVEQKNLLDLIEYLAAPLNMNYLVDFLSNYRAKRYREAFQVIDGN